MEEVNINVCTIGHVDHGKTTLTAAMTMYCAKHGNKQTKVMAYNDIDKAPEEKTRGITINSTTVEYFWGGRHYSHTDCPGHADFVKNMITGSFDVDCALLVISAGDGIMPQTKEHVLLIKQTGVKKLIVVLNKCDTVQDPFLLEMVEQDIVAFLKQNGYENVPIMHCSALKSYEASLNNYDATTKTFKNNEDTAEEQQIGALLNMMDKYIETPIRDIEKPFLLSIEDVFTIAGRGTVVTGKVERGKCSINDEVEIVGFKPTQKTTVTGLESFRKAKPTVVAGDNIGALLRGIGKDDVQKGQVLAKKGSIKAYNEFRAEVYVLTADEGGRANPFTNHFSPQVFLKTANVTCNFNFPDGVEIVKPGETVELTVKLIYPIALEKGMTFSLRESKKTIASGKITAILDGSGNEIVV
ncbi:MAG: elongation factor Tu [Bacilli bacterium]|nr:elongation factor Tu [Bacilli bacterium]